MHPKLQAVGRALAILFLMPASLAAQTVTPSRPAFDAAALEIALDSLIPRKLEQHHLPGLAFVMVKDGQVVVSKGYGFAELATRRPVDPDRTLFRVASVSKTVTATAVMQLVEAGRLELHADMREAGLAPGIVSALPAPVTLMHLLTHTAGLEERALQRATREPSRQITLEAFLTRFPQRAVDEPGRVIAYNDMGITLAGHLVEHAARLPFEEYVEQRIFRPLGMEHSTFRQQLPPELVEALATGYDFRRGTFHPVPYDYIHQTPPAGLTTTAADMARFLTAHLEGGRYGEAVVLGPEALGTMHARQIGMHPDLAGSALGLWEVQARGQMGLWHGGDWNGYGAVLFMLPEERAGFFAAYNGRSSDLQWELMGWFAARMIPEWERPALPAKSADRHEAPGDFAGTYRSTRYSRYSLAKLPTILAGEVPEIRVRLNDDGTIALFGDRWAEVETDRFVRADGRGGPSYVFIRDVQGRITHLAGNGSEVYERLPWHATVIFHGILALVSLLIFLSAIVPWLRLRRATYRPLARWAWTGAALVALVFLLVPVGIAVGMATTNPLDFMARIPPWLIGLLVLPIAGAALSLCLPVFAILLWRSPAVGSGERVHYVAVTAAALAFTWSLVTWNLVGFHL